MNLCWTNNNFLFLFHILDRFNMGFADVEFETRPEALLAIEAWNGGQLDGEIVEVAFATKLSRVSSVPPLARFERPERPVRSRVPLSPPRRGGRNFSPPRDRRRKGMERYTTRNDNMV